MHIYDRMERKMAKAWKNGEKLSKWSCMPFAGNCNEDFCKSASKQMCRDCNSDIFFFLHASTTPCIDTGLEFPLFPAIFRSVLRFEGENRNSHAFKYRLFFLSLFCFNRYHFEEYIYKKRNIDIFWVLLSTVRSTVRQIYFHSCRLLGIFSLTRSTILTIIIFAIDRTRSRGTAVRVPGSKSPTRQNRCQLRRRDS